MYNGGTKTNVLVLFETYYVHRDLLNVWNRERVKF